MKRLYLENINDKYHRTITNIMTLLFWKVLIVFSSGILSTNVNHHKLHEENELTRWGSRTR